MGNAELETLFAADEEARARIDGALADARRELEEARSARLASRARRIEALEAELAREIETIRSEAERAVLERRRRRAAFLDQRRRETDVLAARGGEAYARILREGPQPVQATPEHRP
jgi:hypothetical protein